MKRKLISLITAFVLIATLIPAAVYAEPKTDIKGACVILTPIQESSEDEDLGDAVYDGTPKTLEDYIVFNEAEYCLQCPDYFDVDAIEDYYELPPEIRNKYTLTKGTDYQESYSNNVNAGEATLTVIGTGSYTGTLSTTFRISKKYENISGDYVRDIDYGEVSIWVPALSSGESIEKIICMNDYELTSWDYRIDGQDVIIQRDLLDGESYQYSSLLLDLMIYTSNHIYLPPAIKGYNLQCPTMYYPRKLVYNGRQKTPKINIEGAEQGTDYKVVFAKSKRKAIGKYKFTVKPISPCILSRTGTFQIIPKRPAKIRRAKRTKTRATVKWSKVKNCSGYQVQLVRVIYVHNEDYSGEETRVYRSRTRKGRANLSAVFKNAKKSRYNYVRVRSYKKVNGSKIWSNWKRRKF